MPGFVFGQTVDEDDLNSFALATDLGLAVSRVGVVEQQIAPAASSWLGDPWVSGNGRLWFDFGNRQVTTGSGGTLSFTLPRSYTGGIITGLWNPGSYSGGVACSAILPIKGNMSARNAFNGIALSGASPVASGVTLEINYMIWGWTVT